MKTVTNRFGKCEMYEISDILKEYDEIAITSTACLSVTSDAWSFVADNDIDTNKSKIAHISRVESGRDSSKKLAIIVLGCQVTDLSILNDIRTAEKYKKQYTNADIYMGGCLGQRFDIQLPEFIKRIDVFRSEQCTNIESAKAIVNWERPFWVDSEEFDKMQGNPYSEGNLFRNSYPLKIGAGCHGKCKYCTIRDTRGTSYEADVKDFEPEVRHLPSFRDIVIVSDSPTIRQMFDIYDIAMRNGRAISIRNIEPDVATNCDVKAKLLILASEGLLEVFHCPIQSNNAEVLRAMNRNIAATQKAIELMRDLRKLGALVATNVIIDYRVENADGTATIYPNLDVAWLNSNFDYWVWNPYFDSKWDIEKAKQRFDDYIVTKVAYNKAAKHTTSETVLIDVEKILD